MYVSVCMYKIHLGEVPRLEEEAQRLLLHLHHQGAVVAAGHLDALAVLRLVIVVII